MSSPTLLCRFTQVPMTDTHDAGSGRGGAPQFRRTTRRSPHNPDAGEEAYRRSFGQMLMPS